MMYSKLNFCRRITIGILSVVFLCSMVLFLGMFSAQAEDADAATSRNDVRVIDFGTTEGNLYIRFDVGSEAPYNDTYVHVNTTGATEIYDYLLVDGTPFISDWSSAKDVGQSFDKLIFYTPFPDGTTIELLEGMAFASGHWDGNSQKTPLSGDTLGQGIKLKKIEGVWKDISRGETEAVVPVTANAVSFAEATGTDYTVTVTLSEIVAEQAADLSPEVCALIKADETASSAATAEGNTLRIRFPQSAVKNEHFVLKINGTVPIGKEFALYDLNRTLRPAKYIDARLADDPYSTGELRIVLNTEADGTVEKPYDTNVLDILSYPLSEGFGDHIFINGALLRDSDYSSNANLLGGHFYFNKTLKEGDVVLIKQGLKFVATDAETGTVYQTGDMLAADYRMIYRSTTGTTANWDFEAMNVCADFVGMAKESGENFEIDVYLSQSVKDQAIAQTELPKIKLNGETAISATVLDGVLKIIVSETAVQDEYSFEIKKGLTFADGEALAEEVSGSGRAAKSVSVTGFGWAWGTFSLTTDVYNSKYYKTNTSDLSNNSAFTEYVAIDGKSVAQSGYDGEIVFMSGMLYFTKSLPVGTIVTLKKGMPLAVAGQNGGVYFTGDTMGQTCEYKKTAEYVNDSTPGWIEYFRIQAIQAEQTEVVLRGEDTFEISVSFIPSNATERGLNYVSDNENVLTVDAAGKVTVVGSGTATVTVCSSVAPTIQTYIKFSVIRTQGIKITPPEKLEYWVGQKLDLKNASVQLTFSDGTLSEQIALTADMVSGFDSAVAGEQKVTVQYQGFKSDFTVLVKEPILESIEIIESPNETVYFVGHTVSAKGGKIKLVFSDGNTKQIDMTDDMLSGYDSEISGEQTVTVTYEGKNATFSVEYKAVVVQSIVIIEPENLIYSAGDTLDLTGGKLRVTNNDGSTYTVDLSQDMVSGYNASQTGVQTLTVNYEGQTAVFKVTVNAAEAAGCGSSIFAAPSFLSISAVLTVIILLFNKRERKF